MKTINSRLMPCLGELWGIRGKGWGGVGWGGMGVGGAPPPPPSLIGESLSLVSVSRLKVTRLSVLSRSHTKFLRLSRLGLISHEKFSDGLVSFASILLSLVSVSSWSGCVVFKNDKAKIQSFSSLKDGSRLGLVEKDTETLCLVSVSPEILSQVKSRSRLVHKKMKQSSLGLVSYKKISIHYVLVLVL